MATLSVIRDFVLNGLTKKFAITHPPPIPPQEGKGLHDIILCVKDRFYALCISISLLMEHS